MGKIVMPKNSALLNEIESVLCIYYEADGWLPNNEYKEKLKQMIGDDQYSSSYTKKSQITSYFGFTEWENIQNAQSRRRITQSGKMFYEALREQDCEGVQEILMTSLETVKFGRDNCGSPDSDSDIEPPSLYIRAILDLGYLTYREFAYMLWKLEDVGANYTDTLDEIKSLRMQGSISLTKEAEKYADCKPIMILVRWGFLSEDSSVSSSKRIIIPQAVMKKYEKRLRNLKIYNIDMNVTDPIIEDKSYSASTQLENAIIAEPITTGCNILLYGVPGSGKSWIIEHEYCKRNTQVERLVFHPDYTNSDFVGQILPVLDGNNQVMYDFVPGPFTNILREAQLNPTQEYVLIIEEINRGNAQAIFGDIFQLLDRTVEARVERDITYPIGTSRYGITNENIAKYVYGDPMHKVRIPSNLSIIGTMNTSDQNVFTLDTAFQRRWKMRLIENNFDNVRESLAKAEILDTGITWECFCTIINKLIVSNKSKIVSAEDKRLGVYFIHENDIKHDDRDNCEGNLVDEYTELIKLERVNQMSESQKHRLADIRAALIQNRVFPEKVIKYLWDDAFKFTPEAIFDIDNFDSLEEVIRVFIFSKGKERFNIFKKNIREILYSKQ